MTPDVEHAAVLRRLHDTDFDALPDELAAIERAIEILSPCPECGGGPIHVCALWPVRVFDGEKWVPA